MSTGELSPIIEIIDRQNQEINRRLEESAKRVDARFAEMSDAIKEMAQASKKADERHAAFEEKIVSQNATIARLEQNQKEMGIKIDKKTEEQDKKINDIEKDQVLNNTLRKAVIWLVGTILTAVAGGGFLVFQVATT